MLLAKGRRRFAPPALALLARDRRRFSPLALVVLIALALLAASLLIAFVLLARGRKKVKLVLAAVSSVGWIHPERGIGARATPFEAFILEDEEEECLFVAWWRPML